MLSEPKASTSDIRRPSFVIPLSTSASVHSLGGAGSVGLVDRLAIAPTILSLTPQLTHYLLTRNQLHLAFLDLFDAPLDFDSPRLINLLLGGLQTRHQIFREHC